MIRQARSQLMHENLLTKSNTPALDKPQQSLLCDILKAAEAKLVKMNESSPNISNYIQYFVFVFCICTGYILCEPLSCLNLKLYIPSENETERLLVVNY